MSQRAKKIIVIMTVLILILSVILPFLPIFNQP